MRNYFQDDRFTGLNYSINEIGEEYDSCHFINCNFSSADLSNVIFTECVFENCNFSSVKISNTSFQQVTFISCKMLGLQFDECNKFGLSFRFSECVLNHSGFYQSNIKNTQFINCQLKQVDFTQADLTESVFDKCDLNSAIFEQTNLTSVNFQSADNFSIDPTKNNIRKAKFSSTNIRGLLDCFDIHVES